MARTYSLNAAARAANAFGRFMIRRGFGGKQSRVLTVAGRKTGVEYSIPVGIVDRDGAQYLVAPYGEVSWVKNARASGRVKLSRGKVTEVFGFEQVSADEAGPVLKAYINANPITKPYFEVKADAPASDFSAVAAAHPVFRLIRPVG